MKTHQESNSLPEDWTPKSIEEEKELKGEELKLYKKQKSLYERINNIDKVLEILNSKFESKKIFNQPRQQVEIEKNVRGRFTWLKAFGITEAWVYVTKTEKVE